MKYIEKRGSTFVFDGGHPSREFKLMKCVNDHNWFNYIEGGNHICISHNLEIDCEETPYNHIQTAVCMMKILIKEGLV